MLRGGERVFLGHLSSLFSSLRSLQQSTGVAWGREGRSGTGGNTLICGDGGCLKGGVHRMLGWVEGVGGGAVSQTQDMYKFAGKGETEIVHVVRT